MSAKRLLGMVVPVVFLASSVLGQVNEAAFTGGRTFVSTQSILSPPAGDPNPTIHFGNEESVAFDYARFLTSRKVFGLYAELPLAIYFRMDLNTGANQIPKDIGALFLTPSVRLNIFSGDSVTPWVSVGGGYGRFRYAPGLNFFGPSQESGGGNTGVVQFGGGLDAWIWHRWGARGEVRDFYSGEPDLSALPSEPVNTRNSRQHNYYVGVGIIHRF